MVTKLPVDMAILCNGCRLYSGKWIWWNRYIRAHWMTWLKARMAVWKGFHRSKRIWSSASGGARPSPDSGPRKCLQHECCLTRRGVLQHVHSIFLAAGLSSTFFDANASVSAAVARDSAASFSGNPAAPGSGIATGPGALSIQRLTAIRGS